jgi:hypothetical protein
MSLTVVVVLIAASIGLLVFGVGFVVGVAYGVREEAWAQMERSSG